jgi:predicted  nucleic acid-binding Zn-ribbon protein
MHDELIAHMRARIQQVRKVMALAHDPRMIDALKQVIAEAEADIAKLEAEAASPGEEFR